MARTKVNFENPYTHKRQLGALDYKTGLVYAVKGIFFPITLLLTIGRVIFYETRKDGKIVQKQGIYEGKL